MEKINCDIVIIGSGAGGATLTFELAKRGKKVILVDKGSIVTKIGTEIAALKFYDKYGKLKSKEGIVIYRTIMVGGSTIVSCGNGVRSLEKELKNIDIDITKELDEAEKDLGVTPFDLKLMGDGTKRILEASRALGYKFFPMPKFIDFERCASCGNCILGCAPKAKWSALNYITQSQDFGTSLITNFKLDSIIVSDKRAIGIKGKTRNKSIEIIADKVVIAAGALETPKILKKLGLSAGNNLFCDLFTVVYGISKDTGLLREPTMAIVNDEFHQSERFILSPFIDTPLSLMFLGAKYKYFKMAMMRDRLLGMMIKIKDEMEGGVNENGVISKKVTVQDKKRLEKGNLIAKEILIKAGVEPKSIIITPPRGAHPGGTAPVGLTVDKNHETKIKNLFVADASVLPEAPGLPPILTIVALSKRLAKIL